MNNKEILIVCALEQETQEELNDWLPFTDNPVWSVLYTGVGKVNATRKLTECFSSYQTIAAVRRNHELVINYGTAGSRELPIGELVDCTKFIQRDMDATPMGFKIGETPFEDSYAALFSHIKNPIGKHYVCGTGDNFVQNIDDEINHIDVFDMEAYALAKTCWKVGVDFVSYKYITDNVNEKSADDWLENCNKGVKEFKEILKYYV